MKYLDQVLKLAALLFVIVLFLHCGVEQSGTTSCSPNVIDSGLQVSMEAYSAGSNTYSVTLCSNSQPSSAVYSVYGAHDESDVNSQAAIRLANITATNSSGASFQVTFKSSDNYFAIYQDKNMGSYYVLDFSQVMVSPHRLPGR